MVTIFTNASNLTFIQIPTKWNQTRLFSLPNKVNPQTLQFLIHFFDPTSSISTAYKRTTTKAPPFSAMSIAFHLERNPFHLFLIILCLFMCVLFITMCIMSMKRYYSRKTCHLKLQEDLHSTIDINGDHDMDIDKELLYNLHPGQHISCSHHCKKPHLISSMPYIPEHFL